DAGLHRLLLGLVVAVDPAGVGRKLYAEFLGLGRRTFLHLHEEGIDVGLRYQARARLLRESRRGRAQNARGEQGEDGRFHELESCHGESSQKLRRTEKSVPERTRAGPGAGMCRHQETARLRRCQYINQLYLFIDSRARSGPFSPGTSVPGGRAGPRGAGLEEPTRNGVDEPSGFRHGRGTNQSGMRAFNERLVLSLVRRHGSLATTEIARMTGPSAQTVSVIMRGLEADRLLVRGAPQRGTVGQPSIPMALNPDGAFFFGLRLGRRSADLVLIDFLGTVRCMLHDTYPYPVPESTTRFVVEGVKEALSRLDKAQAERVAGLGIAMPFELWNWADAAGAPAGAMEAWRHVDMRAEVAARCPFPVYLQNDATAACGAELVFGTAPPKGDFLYLYVGAFIGGGVVIDGRLQTGPTGNAGA